MLHSHYVEAKKIDKQIFNIQENKIKAKEIQSILRAEYNIANFRNSDQKQRRFEEARWNDNFIEESIVNIALLQIKQWDARGDYNECKIWKHGCDKKPVVNKKTNSKSIKWLIDKYADKYWVSRSKAHRIAKCESWYNRCAKFPNQNADCSQYERAINCVWSRCSSATGVYQFTRDTKTEYFPKAWRKWYSAYHAEANIATAMYMLWRWMESRRACK